MNKLIYLIFLLPLGNNADFTKYIGVIPSVEVVSPIYNKEFSKKLIIALEGDSLNAYPDGNGYSICYGNRSFKGEVATEDECVKRLNLLHDKVWIKLRKLYPNLTTSQLAIYSVFYWNTMIGVELDKAIKNNDFCNIENMMLQYTQYKGEHNEGLLKRRNIELYHLNKTYERRNKSKIKS